MTTDERLRRAMPWLLLAAALAFPWVATALDQAFYIGLVRRVLIFGIAAASLNFILGYGGMVSLGHAAFFGIGAYTVGALAADGISNAWIAWPLAAAVAALAAVLIGAVSLRTRGVYFIMITLAFAQMVYYVAVGLKRYGGEDGLQPAGPLHAGLRRGAGQRHGLLLRRARAARRRAARVRPGARCALRPRADRHPRERDAHGVARLPHVPLPPGRVRDRGRGRGSRRRAVRQPQHVRQSRRAALDAIGAASWSW